MTITLNGTTGVTTPAAITTTITSPAATALTIQSAGTTAVTVDTAQNVGIGTSSIPTVGSTTVLAVGNANGGTHAIVQSGSIVYRISASTSGVDCYNPNSSPIGWYTAGVQRMTLDASGNLLVGTTVTPVGNRVNGHYFYADGGYNSRTIASNRDWGISVTSGAILNLYSDNGSASVYAGSINVNGNVATYTSVSDYRLKEVVSAVQNSGAFIDALKPVTFKWKEDGSITDGFLAHEFQKIAPASVSGVKDGVNDDGTNKYQTMQASSPEVIANLVAELQSLRKRITALENK
jgi:hypothetical protein